MVEVVNKELGLFKIKQYLLELIHSVLLAQEMEYDQVWYTHCCERYWIPSMNGVLGGDYIGSL
jgi:hypothetical protein